MVGHMLGMYAVNTERQHAVAATALDRAIAAFDADPAVGPN
jgi:hypothetical protein